MRVIHFGRPVEREEYNRIWDAVFDEFDFIPSPYLGVNAFKINCPQRIYRLPTFVWDDTQESLVGRLMAFAIKEEIYALDYNHLAYAFVQVEPMV